MRGPCRPRFRSRHLDCLFDWRHHLHHRRHYVWRRSSDSRGSRPPCHRLRLDRGWRRHHRRRSSKSKGHHLHRRSRPRLPHHLQSSQPLIGRASKSPNPTKDAGKGPSKGILRGGRLGDQQSSSLSPRARHLRRTTTTMNGKAKPQKKIRRSQTSRSRQENGDDSPSCR